MVSTVLAPGTAADTWNEQLESLGPYYGPVAENDVIDRFSSDFGDGYEAVLYLTNHISGPVILPALLLEGNELQRLETRRTLAGNYIFAYEGHDFMLSVV